MQSKQFEEILAIQRQFSDPSHPMNQIQKQMNLAMDWIQSFVHKDTLKCDLKM